MNLYGSTMAGPTIFGPTRPGRRGRAGGQQGETFSTLDRELTELLGRATIVGGLTETDVRRWVNGRVAQPKSGAPKTVSNYHGLLFAVYATAVRHGLRPDNPCAGYRTGVTTTTTMCRSSI